MVRLEGCTCDATIHAEKADTGTDSVAVGDADGLRWPLCRSRYRRHAAGRGRYRRSRRATSSMPIAPTTALSPATNRCWGPVASRPRSTSIWATPTSARGISVTRSSPIFEHSDWIPPTTTSAPTGVRAPLHDRADGRGKAEPDQQFLRVARIALSPADARLGGLLFLRALFRFAHSPLRFWFPRRPGSHRGCRSAHPAAGCLAG